MPTLLRRSSPIVCTARVAQLQTLFDLAPSAVSEQTWDVDLALPETWNVGVIVGPSGSGKTTIARELFGDALGDSWDWPANKSILDGFPPALDIAEIAGLLCSVGFSSPPAWLRPFAALSTGQQFRVNLARTLAEHPDLAIVDEFGSFVHQQVRQIAAAAVAKAVRRRGGKFVAILVHADAVDYFEPDWLIAVEPGQPVRVLRTRGLLRRPDIRLEIVRTDRSTWQRYFAGHHYLSGDLHRSSLCYCGTIDGEPAAFTAVLPFPHPRRPGWREHRTVCLPDFQGIGIGNAMSETIASLYVATGKPYFSTTSHPAMMRHRMKSPLWKMIRKPGLKQVHCGAGTGMGATTSTHRITAGFEFVGKPRRAEARKLGVAR